MNICKIDGCETEVECKRLCHKHYTRKKRHGDPNVVLKIRIIGDIKFRLFSRRNVVGDCWEWVGALNTDGYGQIQIDGKTKSVHRVSFEIFNGKIKKQKEIDHLCRNRRCFNPVHLEQVSQTENWERGDCPSNLNRKKTLCKNGHPFSKKNTYKYKNGRFCKACHNKQNREWRKRKKKAKK